MKAKNFKLLDSEGEEVSLENFKGKWLIIYFYPKDDTPGCTREGIEFTEKIEKFWDLNCTVLGVSPDSVDSHCNFIEKHSLRVNLLSDPEHEMSENYGVWNLKKMYGKEYYGVVRSTFLINPEGNISNIWKNVKVDGHVHEVLKKLKELQ